MDRWSSPHSLVGQQVWDQQPADERGQDIAVDPDGAFVQGPVSLTEYQGQSAFLYLQSGQVALLVQGDRLRAVYLDGGHHLEIGHGTHRIDADHEIYLLSTDAIKLQWTKQNPLRCGPDEPMEIIGKCRLRVDAPARFYRAFWPVDRQTDAAAILQEVDRAVRESLGELLVPVDLGVKLSAAAFQSRLTQISAADLSEELAIWGLECISFAAYTAEPPVEGFLPETAGQLSVFVHN